MGERDSLEHRLLLRWAKSVNKVLVVGSVAALVIVGARVFNRGESVTVSDVGPIPLKAAWVVFFVLTGAHAFTGYFLRAAALAMVKSPMRVEQKVAAYEDVVAEGGHFVAVAKRRLPEPGQRVVRMGLNDSSTWVAHGSAFLMLVAVAPWWWDKHLRWPSVGPSLVITGIGSALVFTNWLVGGAWAVALSHVGSGAPASYGVGWQGVRKSLMSQLTGVLTAAVGLGAGFVALGGVGAVWAIIKWLT